MHEGDNEGHLAHHGTRMHDIPTARKLLLSVMTSSKMCFQQDVVQGESLLVIPLRLGIIDHAPDVDSYDDLLEVSRLAIELLREHSLAERSQRYPWLQVIAHLRSILTLLEEYSSSKRS